MLYTLYRISLGIYWAYCLKDIVNLAISRLKLNVENKYIPLIVSLACKID